MTRQANRLRFLRPLGLAWLALATTAGPLGAQPVLVALSSMPAPAGGNYSSFGVPVLNAFGQVAFRAATSGPGSGIFAGTPGSPLTAAALTGTAAPAGGVYTGINSDPNLSASGQVAIFATMGGASVQGSFAGTPGLPLNTVALQGTAAPAGGDYTGFTVPVINASGQLAFLAGASGSGTGIFAGTLGSPLTTVALQGTAAPVGGNYTSIAAPVISSSGQVAFQASLSVSGGGIFAGTPGSPLTTVALQGTAAPAGGNYTLLSYTPATNASGQVAFVATTSASGTGIFAGTPGSPLTTAALSGTAAPAGGNYANVTNPVLNASGQVAFVADTSVSGIGIFAGTPGSPLAAAGLQGAAAPNCGGAAFNGTFGNPVLNAAGEVAFLAVLTTGSGLPAVTTATNQGLFAGALGNILLVVRDGDVIDVDPTGSVDDHIVSAIALSTGSGGEDGRGMSFNDSGELVYRLTFTDGSSGIFESQITGVPEPSTLVLTMLGVVGLVVRRKKGK